MRTLEQVTIDMAVTFDELGIDYVIVGGVAVLVGETLGLRETLT
jgi:hypothetical protein